MRTLARTGSKYHASPGLDQPWRICLCSHRRIASRQRTGRRGAASFLPKSGSKHPIRRSQFSLMQVQAAVGPEPLVKVNRSPQFLPQQAFRR